MHIPQMPLHLQLTLFVLFISHLPSALYAKNLQKTNSSLVPQQLARVYQQDVVVNEYWISEKLDGIRARWTGSKLITRAGNIINAPSWFTKGLGIKTLDGELWLGRNSFEKTASIVLRETPTDDWNRITFMLFDLPQHKGNFTQRLSALKALVNSSANPYLSVIPQFKIANKNQLMNRLDEVVAQGAEGLMLHHQNAMYQDGRSTHLFKLKKHQDAEATVIGHLPGKGKYQNMLGALLVELDNGLQFKIGSGFTDLQRLNPPAIGTIITFKHYGYTARGIPRFASFLRLRPLLINQ